MSHIAPLKPEEICDPELLALMARGEALGVPDSLFPRILARSPAHAKAVLHALLLSHAGGGVDHKLKEIIRVQLARTAGDGYFAGLRSATAAREGLGEDAIAAGSGKFDADPRFTAAEQWALRYAREMYLNPENVNAAFYDEGRKHYTEAQIMELGAFIAFHYGMQAFARALGLAPLSQKSVNRDS